MRNMTIDVLGTDYEVRLVADTEDPKLKDDYIDGYCDCTTKVIAVKVNQEEDSNTLEDLNVYRDKVLKHEIVHAFMNESGLRENSWACNEEIVDWIAIQFDKMFETIAMAKKIFNEPDCTGCFGAANNDCEICPKYNK